MDLTEHKDIIVTKAGKGTALTITHVDKYLKEDKWQSNNQKHYKQLGEDSTEMNSKLTNDTTKHSKETKILKDNIAEGLKIAYLKTYRFDFRPNKRQSILKMSWKTLFWCFSLNPTSHHWESQKKLGSL